MTRERAKELLPVIQAFAEGKTVQYKRHGDDSWKDNVVDGSLLFADYNDYRVKPEPRRLWVNRFQSGWGLVFESRSAAENALGLHAEKAVEFVEVIK